MSKFLGLFTRSEIKAGATERKREDFRLPLADLHRLECKACPLNHEKVKSPKLEPTGADAPVVYVLGEMPSLDDDQGGDHFLGKAGKYLRERLPRKLACRMNHVIRTRTPQGRFPEQVEVECCRPSIVRDIEKSNPKIIAGLGYGPLNWVLPEGIRQRDIKVWRGRKFPVKIGNWVGWYYAMLSPSWVLQVKEADGREDDIDAAEWVEANDRDFRQLRSDIEHLPGAAVLEPADVFDRVKIFKGGPGEFSRLKDAVAELLAEKSVLAFDWETNALRPYMAGAKLLSLALAGRSQAVAFALDHPQARWTKTEREKIDRLLQVVFEGTVLVAHNLAFDLEWVAQRVGQKYARSAEYHCTMQQAYVLDERPNSHSLDFCSMLNFGLPLKAQSNVDHNNLQSEELGHLLRYNGGDAVVCRKLFISQRRQLQSLDLSGAYEEHRRRIPTVVLSQILGFPLDQARVEAFDAEYQKKITEALDGIDADPAVAEYKKRFGQFLATSPQNVVLLFRDVLKRGEGRAAKSKKYSVDKKVLEQIDLPIARHVLSLRALSKNHGTYIQPLLKKHERSVVWPDGLLHTQFNTTFTATGRLSSNDPNMQNYPKRNPVSKKIRQAFVAPPGHMIVAVDFGQLEARVIGLMSGDPVLCDALFTDYDIHMVWAEKIVKAWPETCRARHKDLTGKGLKAFRSDVKNQMVFPCFYGSVCSSCARSLEMPREVLQPIYDEFWREFFGVLRWQRRLKQFYAEHGYVECMTGRRRHGPMSSNMVINSPVQGTASDIVVDSMNRLSEYAQETEMWWFQPRLNIHDDLTFIVPEKDLDQTLETIINMMLACPYDWITVPMQVEVEIGRDWYHMEDVGKFKSSHVKKDLSRGSQTK